MATALAKPRSAKWGGFPSRAAGLQCRSLEEWLSTEGSEEWSNFTAKSISSHVLPMVAQPR